VPADHRALLSDLQRQLRDLEDDVRERATSVPDVDEGMRAEHAEARRVGRTATSYGEWLDSQVVQAAVAWVLATVFVRFCEDNGLVDEAWIAGPGERLREATERQQHHLVTHGDQNDRDWVVAAVDHLSGFPAVARLFDRDHDPMFRLEISADAAEEILTFWRRRGDDGELVHDFTDPRLSTRFLGDLYQDLSEAARKQYALLQTPEFVEEFILDLTLDPAIETFGLDGFKMIDPTCGSGHFLLGAFGRLLEAWTRQAPSLPDRERVRRALDSVHGVDVNPFASAIARFRLTVAAMKAEGVRRLADAPGYPLHVGTGDSLLHGKAEAGELFDSGLATHTYASEDLDEHSEILKRGRYHVVVGNPPYITVKDKSLGDAYRRGYASCHRQYALSAPFAELFFLLAVRGFDRPGYVGQITANSFMKREFGKKLIEDFLAVQDLSHVIDSSGAYIPGHGTPTVILVGRPGLARSASLRAVLGIRGEPSTPPDPANGRVWRSIVEHIGDPGFENEYVSVVDLPRRRLGTHPWSLSGGGATDLVQLLHSACTTKLSDRVGTIGFMAVTREDDAYFVPGHVAHSRGVPREHYRPVGVGTAVRDWTVQPQEVALYPYDRSGMVVPLPATVLKLMWPVRRHLAVRRALGGTQADRGLAWYEYSDWHANRATPPSVSFAFVATHNHFSLDRSGLLFIRSAPVVKLREEASENDHLSLLGVLNSSTACFWLKQVSQNKGNGGIGGGIGDEDWEPRYEFTGTKLREYPLPETLPLGRARLIDAEAALWAASRPEFLLAEGILGRRELFDAKLTYESHRAKCIGIQEELDWEVYAEYGILDEDLSLPVGSEPEIRLGERAFEIVLARKVARGEVETAWFDRHRSTPVTEVPNRWPDNYRKLVERRIELIETHPYLKLIERPDCKRRWADDPWEVKQERALRGWLLDRLEEEQVWRSSGFPTTQSVAQLAGRIAGDATFLEVLELWSGRTVSDPAKELTRLLADEHVPYLAAMRYKPSGMRKRLEWEETWALQRREDAGEKVDVPVPPKYTSADFARTSYWRHRGKLDVPKERFISYPGAERGADTSLVLGWAGWDHAEQAQALALMIDDRQRREGWDADRLTPLLAGLAELEPWLHQWHAGVDPRTGQSPAQAVNGVLEAQLGRLHLTRDDLKAWRPPAPARGRGARARG
jgi:hypothetical protein